MTSELYDLSEIRTPPRRDNEDAKTALGLYKLLYLIEAGELGEWIASPNAAKPAASSYWAALFSSP